MKSKVLIAGASGMVGRALVKELEKDKNIKFLLRELKMNTIYLMTKNNYGKRSTY